MLYAFLANAPDRTFLRHSLTLFVLGCSLAALAQTVAMWPEICCDNRYGLRATAAEFASIKRNLPQSERASANGYGNIDNFASLWVLLVPLLVGLYYTAARKLVYGLGLFMLVYAGLLVYPRAAMTAVALGLAAILIYRLLICRQFGSIVVAVVAASALIHMPAGTSDHYTGGL